MDYPLLDSTKTEALPSVLDDKKTHFYCCNENVSICGLDLSGLEDTTETPDPEEEICVVCQAYSISEHFICQICGKNSWED